MLAVERADHVIGAIGHGLLVGGAGAGGGVIEGDGRALPALGVIAGQETVADRLGRRRQAAGDRQQDRHLGRRAVAVAVGRRTAIEIEAAAEGIRWLQAAGQHRAAGEGIQRVVRRQCTGQARQGGVIHRAQQAVDAGGIRTRVGLRQLVGLAEGGRLDLVLGCRRLGRRADAAGQPGDAGGKDEMLEGEAHGAILSETGRF